jgi:ketosteroid isomerase-like protein
MVGGSSAMSEQSRSPGPTAPDVTEASVAVVRQFFDDLRSALNGEPVNPYRTMSDDVEFVVSGQTPLSGTWHGMRSVMEDFMARASPLMGRAAGHGLFPLEFIAQGRQVAVLARGRGSNAVGLPYNNSYFLWFDVENGRITRYIEDFDSSLAWRAIFRCHLE